MRCIYASRMAARARDIFSRAHANYRLLHFARGCACSSAFCAPLQGPSPSHEEQEVPARSAIPACTAACVAAAVAAAGSVRALSGSGAAADPAPPRPRIGDYVEPGRAALDRARTVASVCTDVRNNAVLPLRRPMPPSCRTPRPSAP